MRFACLILFLLSQVYYPAAAQYTAPDTPAAPLDVEGPRQFDFWLGTWDVAVRYFQQGTWLEAGEAEAKIYPVLGGKAVLELWDGQFRNGYRLHGFSLRYFDAEEDTWHLILNWPGPNQPGFSELTGAFRHGRGEFFRTTTDTAGVETLVRYTFSDVTPVSLRWDDAYSTDRGQTWRNQMIMEFDRTARAAAWPAPGEALHTYHTGERCTEEEARRFDVLAGRWAGEVTYPQDDGRTTPLTLTGYRALDGCALLDIVAYERDGRPYEQLRLRSYLPEDGTWRVLHLDDRPGTQHGYETGSPAASALTTTSAPTADAPLTRTRWTHLGTDRIRYETAVSTDEGRRWTVTERAELHRKR